MAELATPLRKTVQAWPAPWPRLAQFLGAFACVFVGLALMRGVGPAYSSAHSYAANAVVERLQFASGARLHFDTPRPDEEPWSMSLHI